MAPIDGMAESFTAWLEREQILHAITRTRPDLEKTLVLDDGKPQIKIPYPAGGFIMIAKATAGRVTRWVVAVPDRADPTIHEPGSKAEIVDIATAALDAARSAESAS